MKPSEDILSSWAANAGNWIATIENRELESRRLATDQAIIDAVCSQQPGKVIDIGCGEGWLVRALGREGIDASGVDAIEELVRHARSVSDHHYEVRSYREIAEDGVFDLRHYDMAVINFALIDKDDAEQMVRCLPARMGSGKKLVIQTLHPFSMAEQGHYETGWKEGSWNGMKREFEQPYRWYFRTLGAWMELFQEYFRVCRIIEPKHPQTGKPLSIIFVLETVA